MKCRVEIIVPFVLAAVVLFFLRERPASGVDEKRENRLLGARPVIDAARYTSLHEAFDAVPAEGGLLRLPPGTFVIDVKPGVHAPPRARPADLGAARVGAVHAHARLPAPGRSASVVVPVCVAQPPHDSRAST